MSRPTTPAKTGYYWVTTSEAPETPANARSDFHDAKVLYWDGEMWGPRPDRERDPSPYERLSPADVTILSDRLEPPKFHWEFTAPKIVLD